MAPWIQKQDLSKQNRSVRYALGRKVQDHESLTEKSLVVKTGVVTPKRTSLSIVKSA